MEMLQNVNGVLEHETEDSFALLYVIYISGLCRNRQRDILYEYA